MNFTICTNRIYGSKLLLDYNGDVCMDEIDNSLFYRVSGDRGQVPENRHVYETAIILSAIGIPLTIYRLERKPSFLCGSKISKWYPIEFDNDSRPTVYVEAEPIYEGSMSECYGTWITKMLSGVPLFETHEAIRKSMHAERTYRYANGLPIPPFDTIGETIKKEISN